MIINLFSSAKLKAFLNCKWDVSEWYGNIKQNLKGFMSGLNYGMIVILSDITYSRSDIKPYSDKIVAGSIHNKGNLQMWKVKPQIKHAY